MGKTIDNPVEKFQFYYNGLNKLLRDFLPKGKKNEEARRIIYDEKNVLINRGAKKDDKGIRGSWWTNGILRRFRTCNSDSRRMANAERKLL